MNKLYYSLIIGILFAVFVWSGSVLAADIEFSAYVDKSALSLTDYLTFTLEVKGAVGSLPAPEIGELEDFRILSGPNESTSIQWINGAMSASKTITFILQPKREGELTIPSAVVTHKRKRYTTEPLTIKVYQGAASSPQSQPRSSTPRQGGQRAPDETKEMGDLFLKVETDRTSLVQNDMVIVTYKLYMLVNVSTYEVTKLPNTVGFWTEEFELPRQPVIRDEIVNGKRYRVATLKKMALFPTRSGKMTIDPLEIQCQVYEKRRARSFDPFDRFFDDPFFSSTTKLPRYVQSEPITLNVKPLPEEGKPANFTGAVGDFALTAIIDKDSVEVNQPITLTVNINGRGNIKLVSLPDLDFPSDFEVYDPEVNIQTGKSHDVVSGVKEYKYLLVPRFPGKHKIAPITFGFYHPGEKRYKTVQSEPFNVSVVQGDQVILPGGVVVSPEQVRLYGQDIHFIKSSSDFHRVGDDLYRSVYYPLAFILPLLGLVAAASARSYYYRRNPQKVRAGNAFRKSKRKIDQAEKLVNTSNSAEFFNLISDSLKGYIADKMGISSAGMILEHITDRLNQAGLSEIVCGELFKLVNESDMGRYAGGVGQNRRELITRSRKILKKMEAAWKN